VKEIGRKGKERVIFGGYHHIWKRGFRPVHDQGASGDQTGPVYGWAGRKDTSGLRPEKAGRTGDETAAGVSAGRVSWGRDGPGRELSPGREG